MKKVAQPFKESLSRIKLQSHSFWQCQLFPTLRNKNRTTKICLKKYSMYNIPNEYRYRQKYKPQKHELGRKTRIHKGKTQNQNQVG